VAGRVAGRIRRPDLPASSGSNSAPIDARVAFFARCSTGNFKEFIARFGGAQPLPARSMVAVKNAMTAEPFPRSASSPMARL
jgi:hypothetical protein